jgi:hypothetical protein
MKLLPGSTENTRMFLAFLVGVVAGAALLTLAVGLVSPGHDPVQETLGPFGIVPHESHRCIDEPESIRTTRLRVALSRVLTAPSLRDAKTLARDGLEASR